MSRRITVDANKFTDPDLARKAANDLNIKCVVNNENGIIELGTRYKTTINTNTGKLAFDKDETPIIKDFKLRYNYHKALDICKQSGIAISQVRETKVDNNKVLTINASV
jgi:hypothetical protein